MTLLPAYTSGLYIITPNVVASDRENRNLGDITKGIIRAKADSDIDRAGAKSRCEMTASDPALLPGNQWIAPYLEVVPEVGESDSAQMGLYRLGEPTVTWDGVGGGIVENSGRDIIDLINDSVMTKAETTYPNTGVMGEVERSIQLATLASYGRNVNPNTTNRPVTDWGTEGSSSGWSGTSGLSTREAGYPRGIYAWRVSFNPGSVAGAGRWLTAVPQEFPVPSGARRLYLSHYYYATHPYVKTGLTLRFYDASGTLISSSSGVGTPYQFPAETSLWRSHIELIDVPEGAVTASTLFFATTDITVPSGDSPTAYLCGPEVGAVLGDPVTRIALPNVDGSLTGPMSHPAGTRWLERINDLLAAIGYHGLYATPDGQPTSRPQRDPRRDTPSRVYTVGRDSRIVGEVVTTRSRSNVYNRVVVIKESFEEGTDPMVAVAENNDPDHPWSTVNAGPKADPEPIFVNEVSGQDALQALADAALARASEQETLTLEVLPDPNLTVHDIIEVTGVPGPASGKWAVESIEWGLTSDNPLVRIGARRTVTTGEVAE